MANIIEIDTQVLSSDYSRLESLIEQLRASQNSLISDMQELDAMWEGPANATFIEQYSRDNEVFTELIDALQKIVGCLDFARTNYDDCESEVHKLVSSINV